ncbi:hypothetical protein V6Z12_D11G075700 [Gossypium hirsutum]
MVPFYCILLPLSLLLDVPINKDTLLAKDWTVILMRDFFQFGSIFSFFNAQEYTSKLTSSRSQTFSLHADTV